MENCSHLTSTCFEIVLTFHNGKRGKFENFKTQVSRILVLGPKVSILHLHTFQIMLLVSLLIATLAFQISSNIAILYSSNLDKIL